MSDKIFKNYQVNLGLPFQVKAPLNFDTIQKINVMEQLEQESSEDILLHARKESGGIVARAHDEAEMIIREAKLEADRFMEEAKEQAYREGLILADEAQKKGYEDGLAIAQQQYEEILREAELIRENAKVQCSEVLAGIESDAVKTIMEIARKVIGTELSFNKEDLLYLVKQGFDRCTNRENAVLRVSPEDYGFMVENKERLLTMIECPGDIEIRKDASLKAGGCIVETLYGSVDAGMQTKLERIEEAFTGMIGKESEA